MSSKRTRFFVGACMLTFAAMGALLSSSARAADQRSYTAGRFALELNNASAGNLRQVSGGGIRGTVIADKAGATPFPKKHLGGIKYEDLVVQGGAGMSKGFFDWMKASIAGSNPRMSVALVESDFDYTVRSKTTFQNALISDITFPALDASSRDAAYFTVAITPELSRRVSAGGKMTAGAGGKVKQFLSSNFRVKIPGLEEAMSSVSKVESLGVRFKPASDVVGELREYQKTATTADVSNLVLFVSEARAASLYKWQEEFVVNGKHADADEKTVTIEMLDAAQSAVLFSLTLRVGLVGVSTAPLEQSQAVRNVRAEMYVESIAFDYTPSAI